MLPPRSYGRQRTRLTVLRPDAQLLLEEVDGYRGAGWPSHPLSEAVGRLEDAGRAHYTDESG